MTGLIQRGIDRLPMWARSILLVLGVLVTVYGFAHYGISFLLHVIFSPIP
jgi:hypothetical protein